MIALGSFLVGNVVSDLFDCGVANILEVQTLRHGTNFFNYISIRLRGGDPNHGGKASGSTNGWSDDNTKHWFYLFKDKEYSLDKEDSLSYENPLEYLCSFREIGPRLLSKMHGFLSGYNLVKWKESCQLPLLIKVTQQFLSVFSGILHCAVTPILRFRFDRIDPSRMANDGCAYRTDKLVEAWRIGMIGSFFAGVNAGWFARVKAEPLTLLIGVVQVTCAVALAVLCVHVIVANPYLLIPGMVGAILC
jgi:hypothetical protein